MMDITCDSCGKKYRIDETKMRKESAKVKCKTCDHIMVITKPEPEPVLEAPVTGSVLEAPVTGSVLEAPVTGSVLEAPVTGSVLEAPVTGSVLEAPISDGFAEQGLTQEVEVPRSVVDQPAPTPPSPETEPEPQKEIPAYYGGQRVRFGLFTKIIIVMLFISLVPFLSFWGLSWQETNERIRSDTEALMAQTAEGLGKQVDNWINYNVSILEAAARLPAMVSMERETQEAYLKNIGEQYPYIYLAFTVGLDGMNVARSDGKPLKDYSDRQYYKDVIQGKNLTWQSLIGKTSKKPALVLAVPIKSGDQIIGVMAGAMNVDTISQNIATWKAGKTGRAFLIDEKGFVVAHPIKQYVVKRKNLNSDPLISNFRKRGWTTITTQFKNAKGNPTLGHVRSTKKGWALVLQQEESEVFEALDLVQRSALILLACTILVVTIIAWLSARAIVTPMRKLTDAAERMSLGELNVKIDVKSRDEIGLLAQAVGRMQTSLRLAMNRLRRKR